MRTLILASKMVLFLVAAGLPLQDAWANPAGESIVAGSVDIQRRQDLMQIQATDGAIIDWHSGFNIAPHETVEFIQPCPQCKVLNNDKTFTASIIDGHLLANGHVIIANPFGVWFGASAVVDVAHLTAAAGSISNEDFLNGRLHLTGVDGDVFNAGSIRAQRVALIGRQVANRGQIVSADGSVWMLAGEEVWVGEWGSPIQVGLGTPTGDEAAVTNDGTIDAGRGSVRMAAGDLLGLALRNRGTIRGGQIVLDGATGDVEVSGSLDASNRGEVGRGGRIEIAGDRIALRGASLNASGETGGGQIEVGGRAHGAPRDLGNANQTAVDADSVLRADALDRGDGGQVVVWADDSTRFHGEISARGGAQGGGGGFVETSGRNGLSVAGARVDASAPAGQAGNWLLDPRDVDIVSSENFAIDEVPGDPIVFSPNDDPPETSPAQVDAEIISTTLETGTNVTIQTMGSTVADQEGTIRVLSGITTTLPEGQEATLTLKADADIRVSESIEDTGSGALNVTLEANRHIVIESPLVIPDGQATLEAGQGGDSGYIVSSILGSSAITAGQLDMTAIDFIAALDLDGLFDVSTPTLSAEVTKGDLWIEQTGTQDLHVLTASTGAGGELKIENTGGGLRIDAITTRGQTTEGNPANVEIKSAADILIRGAITTDGGQVNAGANGNVDIDFDGMIDTRPVGPADPNADPVPAGDIEFDVQGDIRVAGDLSASLIDLFAEDAENDPSACAGSAICFAPNANSRAPFERPVLAAQTIELKAGNPSDSIQRVVDARNAIFTGAETGTNPDTFRIVQTADLQDDPLPDATAFGSGSVADQAYEIEVIRAGASDLSPKSGIITLGDASKFANADLDLHAGEKVVLDFGSDPLELGKLDVQVDGDLEIGDDFALGVNAEDMALRAAANLSVTKPLLNASTSLTLESHYDNTERGSSGSVLIGQGVTLEAPSVSIWGGESGQGDVQFEEDVRFVSDDISLKAGSGVSSGEDAYKVNLVVDQPGETRFEQTETHRSLTINQDASIATADLPRASAFTEDIRRPPGHQLDGLNYTLVSRRGQILVDPAASSHLTDAAKFKGTNLTLLAEEGVSITTASPIEVNSAVIGGLGPFTVTKPLADRIRFAKKADGSDADGRLTFVSGAGPFEIEDPSNPYPDLEFEEPESGDLEILADELTLSAGFYFVDDLDIFWPNSRVALPADGLVFRNQHGDRHSAPDRFEFRQTDSVLSSNLPGALLFGNAEGPQNVFSIESIGSIALESPASLAVPEGSKLVAKAPAVAFQVTDQDLDLGERDLEIETTILLLSAGRLDGNADYRVLAQGLNPESLRLAEGSLLQIHQEGAIRGNELPTYEAWGGNEGPKGVIYQLRPFAGGIDLSGQLARVEGSQLELLPDKADSAIDFGSGRLEVESLIVTNSGRLQLTGTGTVLQAESSIVLNSACGPLLPSGACDDFYQTVGNLSLQGDLTLKAPTINLLAGHSFLPVAPSDSLPVVEIAPEVRFDLTSTSEETSAFLVQQLGDLTDTGNNLPAPDQFEGTLLADIDKYEAVSQRGNITITNIADLDPAQLNLTANLASKEVRIQQASGELKLDNTTIKADRIVLEALEAEKKGYVTAKDDTLKFDLGSNGIFEILQSKAFDPTAADSGALPFASQFGDSSSMTYKVTSTGGNIVVDPSFGPSAAGSDLVLQSGEGKAVEFEAGFDSDAPLESLSVNTDDDVFGTSIVLGIAGGPGAYIESQSGQVYGAEVELRSDAHLVAGSSGNGSIVFTDTVKTDTAGDHGLAVEVDNSVRFSGDVGEADARLESLEIKAFENSPNTSAVALFGPEEIRNLRNIRVAVYTDEDIELFAAGRSAIPATATVSMQHTHPTSTLDNPDLRFDSANGSVLMGTNEKLSVPGALVIEASSDPGSTTGEARVGDLSALAMRVKAPTITLLRRGEGPILYSDGTVGTDGGVDYVANTMTFEGNVGSTGSGRTPGFGLPDPFSTPDFVRANNYPAASINVNNTPLAKSEFTVEGQLAILDLQPLGASSADLAEAFWIPTPLPFLQAPPQRLAADPARLIEIGMALLPTSVAEYQSRLRGAGLLDDVDSGIRLASAPAWVSEARILPTDANQALAAYRRVLGPRRENAGRIREILQAALDDYRSLTGARRVVGFEFRRYLKNRPSSQFEAYVALQDLDALFLHQRRSGLVASEFQHIQEAWLEEITPDGITPAELSQAIFPSRYVRGSEILDVYGE